MEIVDEVQGLQLVSPHSNHGKKQKKSPDNKVRRDGKVCKKAGVKKGAWIGIDEWEPI